MLCFNLFYFTQNMDKNSPRDAGLKKEGRTEGMLSVGSGSGLPPASAAPPEPGGAEWTPLRLLDPQDRPPPDTAQSRTRAGSLQPSPTSGPQERDSHSGPCDLEVHFGSRDLFGSRSLEAPLVSSGQERSLSVAGVPTSSVDEITGRGCFARLIPGSSSTLEAQLPCQPLPCRPYRRFHPLTRASPERIPTRTLGA